MNELENQLSEIIKKSLEVAEKSGEFVIEQAPLLLQEFYHWHIVKSLFFIIIFGVFMIITYKIHNVFGIKSIEHLDEYKQRYYFLKSDKKYYYSEFENGDSMAYIFNIIFKYGSIFWVIGVLVNIYKLIFIMVAPKIYLIEYFVK